MSEQQFGWNYFENEVVIGDKQDKKRMIVIVLSNFMDIPYNRKSFDELVDWLNEQQATITELESDKAIAEDYANIFEKENVKLRKKLNEQQDIIFKLQDLCGKSDYENAKLREEVNLLRPTNLEQYEQIQKLQEENEQLRQKLDFYLLDEFEWKEKYGDSDE